MSLVRILKNSIKSIKNTGAKREYARLKRAYDKMTGITTTKHHLHDSTFYICRDLFLGYRAVKFFNDKVDYRVGAYHPSQAEAYSDAVCWM